MSDARPPRARPSRELRLLVLTIVVSAAVLLLLARLRFPTPLPAVDTSAQPLQRLAARASFEELALRVSRLEAEVLPNLIALRLRAIADPGPLRLDDLTRRPRAFQQEPGHVPALRVDAVTALAAVPYDLTIAGVVGAPDDAQPVPVVVTDHVRGVSRITVPEGPSRALPQLPLASLRTPAYVVAIEGTRAGLTLRPVFLGRSERFQSSRWRQPVLPIGGATVAPGALMFTLDGEFLGCAVLDDGVLAIADAGDFVAAAGAPLHAGGGPVEPGFSVRSLTSDLSRALGVERGVVVAAVDEAGAAGGLLEPGDVVTHVGDAPAWAPEALLLEVSTRLSAGPVALAVVRSREARLVEIVALRPAPDRAPVHAAPLPVLRAVQGVGALVVRVDDESPLARAGLRPGDVVLRLGSVQAPSPTQLREVVGAPRAEPTAIVFRRDGRRMLALLDQTEPGADAPR